MKNKIVALVLALILSAQSASAFSIGDFENKVKSLDDASFQKIQPKLEQVIGKIPGVMLSEQVKDINAVSEISVVHKEKEAKVIVSFNKYLAANGFISEEYARRFVIKELLRLGLVQVVDEDFKGFKIKVSDAGEMTVSGPEKADKDVIDEKIASMLRVAKEKVKHGNKFDTRNEALFYSKVATRPYPEDAADYSVSVSFDEKELADVTAFRTKSELENLFQLTSWRTREAKYDMAYRRFNITTAYSHLGGSDGITVVQPGQKLSYAKIVAQGDDGKTTYKEGKAIVKDEEVEVYGGGLCGGATGIFQGTLLNSGLQSAGRNHSVWYGSLYKANINGTVITTPGLDRTYFSKDVDMTLKNVTKYPIVIHNAMDAKTKKETNYSLSVFGENNRSEIQFLKKDDKCYSWKVGDKTYNSCYKTIK